MILSFRGGKAIGWFFGILIGLGVLGMIVNILGLGFQIAWLPFGKMQAQVSNTQGIINTVYDPQRCIAINAQFQTLVATVPAIRDEQIPNAKKALTDYEAKLPVDQTKWSVQQQQMDGEMQTNVTGLEQQLSQIQAQYNAFMAREDVVPCAGHLPTWISIK